MKNSHQKFNTILTEFRAHQDEQCGTWQLCRFGENFFPGIKTARIQFMDRPYDGPKPGQLDVGIGQEKSEFDEHRAGGRIQNECAATLVAKRLRITDKPGLRELLKEVLWCDTRPKVFTTQFANLVKARHRTKKGEDQYGTHLWCSAAFDAIVFGRRNDQVDLRSLWDEYCDFRKLSQKSKSGAFVTRLIGESFERRDQYVTELSHIAACMKPEVGYRWLQETFEMMVKDSEMFFSAVAELNGDGVTVVDAQGERDIEPVFAIQSNNELISRAAASVQTGKASVCIVRNSKGLVQVFSNPELGFNMYEVGAILRMAEYRKKTGQSLSVDVARSKGDIKVCPQWHIPNGNTILNGSLTHPWIPPTMLTLEEIQAIIASCLTKGGRDIWISDYQGSSGVTSLFEEGDSLDGVMGSVDRAIDEKK